VTYENSILLRLVKNPYAPLLENPRPFEKLPFFLCTPIPKRASTYGWSLVERIRPLQREINVTRNNRRVVTDMELGSKVLYDETRGVDVEALKSARYGGLVPVQGPPAGAVQFFQPRTTTAQLLREEMVMDQDLRDLTGVTEPHLGRGPGGGVGQTATGISIVASEGDVVQQMMTTNVKLSLMLPLGRYLAACAMRFVKPKEMVALLGLPEDGPLPPKLEDVLKGQYTIDLVSGVSSTSRAVRLRNLSYATQALAQVASAAPQAYLPAIAMLNAELLRTLGISDVAGYLEAVNRGALQRPATAAAAGAPRAPGQAAGEAMPREAAMEEQPAAPRGGRAENVGR